MNFNGKKVTMECFVFSQAMERREDLEQWRQWFLGKGIFAFIREREDGRYDLIREGKEAPTDMPCEPTIGPCLHCGAEPPHAFGWTKYCNEDCRDSDYIIKRRLYEKDN